MKLTADTPNSTVFLGMFVVASWEGWTRAKTGVLLNKEDLDKAKQDQKPSLELSEGK